MHVKGLLDARLAFGDCKVLMKMVSLPFFPRSLREPEPQPTLVTRQSAPPILELCGPSGRAQDHADAADDPSQVWYIAASQRGAAKAPGFAAPSEDRSGGPSRSVDRRGSERSAQTGMAPQYKLATSASSAQRPTGPEAGSEASCRPAHTPEPYVQLRTSTPPAPAPTPFHVVATTLPAVTDGVARGGAAPDCLAVLQGLLRAVLPATQQHAAAQHQVQRPSPPRCANGWEEAARSGVPLRAIPLSPALLRAQDPMLELLQRQRAAEFERRCWA